MFDVVSFLADYGIDSFTEGVNCQEGWVNICCPLCDDKSNHGGFELFSMHYNCWRCGSSSVQWVIKTLLNSTYTKAKEIIDIYDSDDITNVKIELKKIPFFIPDDGIDIQHRIYLEERGYNPNNLIDKYSLLGTGKIGKYAYRIVVPIFYKNRIISWQSRSIIGREPRYLNCPKNVEMIPAKSILYNLNHCFLRRVIVVEGVFDVFRFGDNCCSVLGTGFTGKQVNLLDELFDEIFIYFDPGAEEKAEQLGCELSMLGNQVEIIYNNLEPDEMADEDVVHLVKEIF